MSASVAAPRASGTVRQAFERFAESRLSMAIFIALVLVIATVTVGIWTRYGKYMAPDGVPRDSIRIEGPVRDFGVASNGQVIGLLARQMKDETMLEVVAWDSLGRTRQLFGVYPFKMRGMQQAQERSLELVDARIAPIGTRVAAIWRGKSGNYLSMSDGRGADTLVRVGRVRNVAISTDGFVLALSDGSRTQVIRFSSIAPETLLTLSTPAMSRVKAVSSGGRVALRGAATELEVVGPTSRWRVDLRDSSVVNGAAFLAENRLAVVGQFPGIKIADSAGSRTIAAAGAGQGQEVAALDSNVVVRGNLQLRRYTVRSVEQTRPLVRVGIPILAYFFITMIAGPYLEARRKRVTAAAVPNRPAGLGEIPLPDLPSELVEACARGDCVLFAGAGVSAASGYPTWTPFVTSLVTWAAEQKFLESAFKQSLLSALASGQTNSVAFSVVSTVLQSGHGADLQKFLEETFGPSSAIQKVHKALVDAEFGGVLTSNLDTLLERTFAQSKLPVYTPKDSDQLLNCLSVRAPFLLKLYGSLDRPPVFVAPAQFQAAVVSNLPFTEFSQQLYVSRTLLFMGTSLQGITDYVDSLTVHRTPDIKHFALVAIEEVGWEPKAKLLEERYGIHVLGFTPSDGYPEVTDFATQLAEQAKEARKRTDEKSVGEHRPGALTKLTLKNVGPFEEIEIDLDPHITVLLGDNGLGKSTILRAMGLALAASDQEPRAGTLIRSKPGGRAKQQSSNAADGGGQDESGQIVLETRGGKTYTTIIGKRATEGVRIQFQPHSWQRGENQLALGFPPLRSVSADAVSSPSILEDRSRPVPSDVLPIVGSDPDARVTDLKKWLVSMDYRRHIDEANKEKTDRMLKDFFETINQLLEGVSVNFQGLKVKTGEVRVQTEDGDVPIHVLSQGTVSMMGLIGILLPRLYDVHPTSPHPRKEFAIALIDEIDAHMHPRWQQTLISKLRELFPKVQFIVTTHSPFIAAGREKSEIVRLRREDETRQIVVAPTYADTKGVDVASLLTGYLFGLDTPVDPETERAIVEQRELMAAERLNKDQEKRLRELNVELGGVVTGPTHDPQYNTYLRVLGERDRTLVASRSPQTGEEEQAKLATAREVLADVRAAAGKP